MGKNDDFFNKYHNELNLSAHAYNAYKNRQIGKRQEEMAQLTELNTHLLDFQIRQNDEIAQKNKKLEDKVDQLIKDRELEAKAKKHEAEKKDAMLRLAAKTKFGCEYLKANFSQNSSFENIILKEVILHNIEILELNRSFVFESNYYVLLEELKVSLDTITISDSETNEFISYFNDYKDEIVFLNNVAHSFSMLDKDYFQQYETYRNFLEIYTPDEYINNLFEPLVTVADNISLLQRYPEFESKLENSFSLANKYAYKTQYSFNTLFPPAVRDIINNIYLSPNGVKDKVNNYKNNFKRYFNHSDDIIMTFHNINDKEDSDLSIENTRFVIANIDHSAILYFKNELILKVSNAIKKSKHEIELTIKNIQNNNKNIYSNKYGNVHYDEDTQCFKLTHNSKESEVFKILLTKDIVYNIYYKKGNLKNHKYYNFSFNLKSTLIAWMIAGILSIWGILLMSGLFLSGVIFKENDLLSSVFIVLSVIIFFILPILTFKYTCDKLILFFNSVMHTLNEIEQSFNKKL